MPEHTERRRSRQLIAYDPFFCDTLCYNNTCTLVCSGQVDCAGNVFSGHNFAMNLYKCNDDLHWLYFKLLTDCGKHMWVIRK